MITSNARIAEHFEMSTQNLGKTYFNGDPKKEKMGKALDRETYLAEKEITDSELMALVEGFYIAKKLIKDSIKIVN